MYRRQGYTTRVSSAITAAQTELPGAVTRDTVPAERVTNPESVRLSSLSAAAYVDQVTLTATTLAQRAADAVTLAASDPYDPATRFARFFPPAPVALVCPERLPSNEPAPSTIPCAPVVRYVGSSVSEPGGGAI
jgi:hypothetical protein